MKKNFTVLFFLCFLSTSVLFAQDYAVALKASTYGINLEGIRSFGPEYNARLGVAFFSYTIDGGGGSDEDFTYSGDLKLSSISVLGDWFPFTGTTFRVTAGAFINLNKANLVLTPTETYTIGGTSYSPSDLGTLTADIKFNKIAPYLGIGFGNPVAGAPGFDFTFDIGAMYHGAPAATMNAQGLLEPTASQASKLEDNLSWFRFYPVVSFGLSYKF
jgi:hypothetical protein